MKIALSTESTVDLTSELIKKYNINIIPYTVILGEEYKEDGTFPTSEIFDFVKKTKILPKTTAINEFQYEEFFGNLLKENDAVIHISLSGEITSAVRNAKLVAEKMKNVYIIDSKSLSTGIALLAIYASKLIEKGLEPQEIVEKVSARIPDVQASFVIDRLDYLYKGGRCSSLQLLGSNILKIHPQILLVGGKMITGKKYRGPMDVVVKNYCEDVLKEFNNPDRSIVFITYTVATEKMVENAKAALINNGFLPENIYQTNAGCTITSHCGENTLGILYINDGGKE